MKTREILAVLSLLLATSAYSQLPGCATTINTFPYNEGFEAGFGNWTNITGDVFDWTRDSGGTTSGSTGPTTGSAASTWYMYIETSSPRTNGDEAWLESDCFDFTALTNPTMDFDYHMYGATINTLELLVSTDGVVWNSAWSLTGNQGNAWNTASVDLSAYAGQTVGFRFRGVSGTSFTGDIAIDDLTIYNATPMVFVSSTTTQTNTSTIETCSVDSEIIGIQVVTSGTVTPIDLTQMIIQTTGSTNPLADIGNIDIYYTGTSATFTTGTLFGSSAAAATGVNITIPGSQTLANGTNYFWLAYDMAAGATVGNVVDALCSNLTVNGTGYAPTVSAPAGNRTIVACTPTPGNVGKDNLTAWFRATDLTNGNVTSWTTTYPTGPSAITVTDASAPYPVATETPGGNSSNYNTTIYFDTTNLVENIGLNLRALENNTAMNLLDNTSSGDQGTFFGNYYFPTYFDNNDHIMCYNEGSGAAFFDGIQFRNLGANGRFAIGHLGGTSSNATRNWGENHLPTTICYRGNRTNATSMNQYENSLLNTNSSASQCSGSVGLRFGYKVGTNTSQYKGFLNEFIFFNRDLSVNEMRRIDSYLSIKYGVTMPNTGAATQGDYLSTSSLTVWDADLNPTYHNNVIGIGRDDSQELLQKQSHSFYDTTRVYLGNLAATNPTNTGAFSNDISYVMVGDNQGEVYNTATSVAEMPGSCGLYSRLEREWKITRTNMADDFSMDITLHPYAVTGSVNVAELRVLIDDDGNFAVGSSCYFNGDGTGITISYNAPVITIQGLSTTHIPDDITRYLTIASTQETTPLPVELVDFELNCKENNVAMTWTTVSESNNDYFTIERSRDGNTFETLAEIDGHGTTTSEQHYQWTDNAPLSGMGYYRIAQTDFDGTTAQIATRSAHCTLKDQIDVYPNPFEDILTVVTALDAHVEIIDIYGKTVTQKNITAGNSNLTLNDLASGVYIVRVTLSNGHVEDKKIIKV